MPREYRRVYDGPRVSYSNNRSPYINGDPTRSGRLDQVESEELDRKIMTSDKSANQIAWEIGCSQRTVVRHRSKLRTEGRLH